MAVRTETIGDCTLILGDALEVLPTLGKVDCVVTDPPYGIGHKHSGRCSARSKWQRANDRPIHGDAAPFDPRPFLGGPAVLFGADHFAASLPAGGVFHVWDKECGRSGRSDSFSDAEIFWTSWHCKRQVVRYLWKGLQVENPAQDGQRFHPTQKPVAVMMRCIRMLPDRREIILDPFMGSGTTLVACAKLGRKGIGVEIEPRYFDIACKRVEEAYRQPRLDLPEPVKPTQEAMAL